MVVLDPLDLLHNKLVLRFDLSPDLLQRRVPVASDLAPPDESEQQPKAAMSEANRRKGLG